MKTLLIFHLLLLAPSSTILHAQPIIEPITQNPDAVLLRRIWTVTGSDGDRVGQGCGPVGDINGDSITDFAVQYGTEQRWKVFVGGSPAPSILPITSIPSLAPYPAFPVYGKFYGDDRLLVGFGSHTFKTLNGTNVGFYHLKFYQPDAQTGLSNEPVMVVEPDPDMADPVLLIAPSTAVAINMDHQAGDELLLALQSVRRGDSVYKRPEYWLYRGGSTFQVDTPDYVVRDTEPTTDQGLFTAKVMDLDGDRYMDLLSLAKYAEGFKLKLWFGTETSPWTWTTPDREVLLDDSSGLNYHLTVGDFDGDKVMDYAGTAGRDATRGTYIYLSRSGKSVRQRSFIRSDADRWFPNLDQYTIGIAGSLLNTTAYLNDSSQQVIMLRLQTEANNQTWMSLASGSRNGPDGAIDGYYSSGIDGLANQSVEGYGGRVPDCTGDGWDDLITSSPRWLGDFSGIAVILAGGPYIPLDQPTVSVRTEPIANHQKGLYLWPNPATTELNIAWRGDLAAMPVRFAVHDITGTMITENEVRPGLGSARWSTAGVASGTYLLTAYDRSGKVIASVQIAVAH